MIAIAGIPLAISFVCRFSPLDNLSDLFGFLWLVTFAVLVRGSLTFYHIPHLALGAEMAHDYHQRSTLFGFNTFFGAMGGAVATIVIYLSAVVIGASTLPIIGVTYNSMYADLADQHELRTGKRREGAIYWTRAFANKATGALGLVIGGEIIDVIAFPENATYGTVPLDIIWSLGFLSARQPQRSP